MTLPVNLKSDQGPVGRYCFLCTNVDVPLGLMTPGPGMETRERGGTSHVAVVRLLKAERYQSFWNGQ